MQECKDVTVSSWRSVLSTSKLATNHQKFFISCLMPIFPSGISLDQWDDIRGKIVRNRKKTSPFRMKMHQRFVSTKPLIEKETPQNKAKKLFQRHDPRPRPLPSCLRKRWKRGVFELVCSLSLLKLVINHQKFFISYLRPVGIKF